MSLLAAALVAFGLFCAAFAVMTWAAAWREVRLATLRYAKEDFERRLQVQREDQERERRDRAERMRAN